MLGLPVSTEVKKSLPKEHLYRQFDWKASQRESFDGDVSRLNFVNWISPRSLPALTVGAEIKEIMVVEVTLKHRDFDVRNIELLAKSIPQRIVYVLRDGEKVRIAVYHTKLFMTDWQFLTPDSSFLILQGLNLDAVWENIVTKIGNFEIEGQITLTEQIVSNEERDKLERKIRMLESKISSTRQPRRKRELYLELQKLKHKTHHDSKRN
ncbi:MAG: DUF4391 domain-containing protein [Muribaculaceae bacterium]|nr:DUF4391 domain-containing protein [Muribaculaceae bacterium]